MVKCYDPYLPRISHKSSLYSFWGVTLAWERGGVDDLFSDRMLITFIIQIRMNMLHRYSGWFQLVKVLKRNYLHRNVLTTGEVLWGKFHTKYLTYFCIITFSFSVKIIVSTHKHVITFTRTMISPKDVKMWKIKSKISIYGM